MKILKILVLMLSLTLVLDGCAMVKRFFGKKAPAEMTYDDIERLRSSYAEGRAQALEELISIYRDSNQPFDYRLAAGEALAETHHPTALNAIAEVVGEAEAMDLTLMEASIELLATFRDDPRAADAMVQALHQIEEKTNSLHLTLVRNLNRVRSQDQVLALLELYQVSQSNLQRTEKLLTETLGALGTDEVVPILVAVSKNPEINVGIRNRALEILGKKEPREVASAFAELLGDPATNLEVREFALNTMAGVREENLILALLDTYNTGKRQYYSMLNTLLDALGEFDDPQIKKAVLEIALGGDYPPQLRNKAIRALGGFGDPEVVPDLLPLLGEAEDYTLHPAVIATIKQLGRLDQYQEEIRRLAFRAHRLAPGGSPPQSNRPGEATPGPKGPGREKPEQ